MYSSSGNVLQPKFPRKTHQQLIYPEEVTHYHILIERPLNDSENRKEFLSDSDQNAPSRYDLMSLMKLGIEHTLAEHLDQLWNWFYTR